MSIRGEWIKMWCVCMLPKLCLTHCHPTDCSPPGSSVHVIFPARILEWGAISFSRRSTWPKDRTYDFCTAGRFLYHWASWKATVEYYSATKNEKLSFATTWMELEGIMEKTVESPLDCKEIHPVHPEGAQSWVFIGRTDAEAETLICWPPHAKNWFIGKDPDAGRD